MEIPLEFWIKFWAGLFFVSLVLFSGMAIVVAIGGFFNIKDMFKALIADHKQHPQQTDKPTHD
jgi:hypothetical protein